MRLFAALPLPPHVAQALDAARLASESEDWPVRWVAPAALHVTVAFFGEVPPASEPLLRGVLDEAVRGTGPLALESLGVRPFPHGARARMVWLELAGEPALELLAHRVALGARAAGVATDGAAFRPHVTLGRVARGARLPRVAAARLASVAPPAAFVVDRVTLVESRLGAGPPRYEVRHAAPLVA